jgi:adenine specific DNA methylase Mod
MYQKIQYDQLYHEAEVLAAIDHFIQEVCLGSYDLYHQNLMVDLQKLIPSFKPIYNVNLYYCYTVQIAETGAIYLHCDWHKSHQLKLIMDEIFGIDNFRNEIIWCYKTSMRLNSNFFGRDHDNILFYSRSLKHKICPDRTDFPSSESTIKRWESYADENGFVSNKHFAGSNSTIIDTSDETKGFNIYYGIPRDWWEISSNVSKGNTDEVIAGKYPTQKPEKLLERIIKASTQTRGIVFDCFMHLT